MAYFFTSSATVSDFKSASDDDFFFTQLIVHESELKAGKFSSYAVQVHHDPISIAWLLLNWSVCVMCHCWNSPYLNLNPLQESESSQRTTILPEVLIFLHIYHTFLLTPMHTGLGVRNETFNEVAEAGPSRSGMTTGLFTTCWSTTVHPPDSPSQNSWK